MTVYDFCVLMVFGSVFVLALIVAVLAFAGDISVLASATSLLLLVVFALMNASLIVLKLRPGEPGGRFEIPVVVPALGFLVCGALVVSRLVNSSAAGVHAPLIAVGLIGAIAILFFVVKPAVRNFAESEA